jgi:hypothetical protein
LRTGGRVCGSRIPFTTGSIEAQRARQLKACLCGIPRKLPPLPRQPQHANGKQLGNFVAPLFGRSLLPQIIEIHQMLREQI